MLDRTADPVLRLVALTLAEGVNRGARFVSVLLANNRVRIVHDHTDTRDAPPRAMFPALMGCFSLCARIAERNRLLGSFTVASAPGYGYVVQLKRLRPSTLFRHLETLTKNDLLSYDGLWPTSEVPCATPVPSGASPP